MESRRTDPDSLVARVRGARRDGRRPYFRRKYEAALDQWIRAMAERR
jgi:hypothetical protein